MIVEFVGMPGSGKSAICRSVEKSLRAKGYAVRAPIEKATRMALFSRVALKTAAICGFALRKPIAFSALAFRLRMLRNSLSRAVEFPAFNYLFVAAATSAGKSFEGVVLIDQGLMQGTASLAYSVGDSAMLHSLRQEIARFGLDSDMIIFVDASEGELIRRLSSRSVRESRVEDDPENGIMRFRKAISIAEGLFFGDEQEAGRVPMRIENETAANLDESTETILRCIEKGMNRCR